MEGLNQMKSSIFMLIVVVLLVIGLSGCDDAITYPEDQEGRDDNQPDDENITMYIDSTDTLKPKTIA